MIRKFNFTGRKKINVDDIKIQLEKDRGNVYFDASISSLDKYGIKPDAKLVLEAFDRGSYQRFNWGTVSHPIPPNPEDRKLTEIQEAEMVNFRLKAIDDNESIGRILATTKCIRIWAEEVQEVRKASLLPVTPFNIGNSIWEIDFDVADDDVPRLLINDRFDNVYIKEMLRSDAFFTTLIYPSVLNIILTQIILVNDTRTTDGSGWESKWLKFTLELPGVEPIPRKGNIKRDREWINNSVSAFCKIHSMVKILKSQISNN